MTKRRAGKRRALKSKIASLATVFLAICFLTGLIWGLFLLVNRQGTGRKVPYLVGLRYGEALQKAEKADITVEISPEQDQDSVRDLRSLKVSEQDPKGGTPLDEQASVLVWLEGLKPASGKREASSSTRREPAEKGTAQDATHSDKAAAPATSPGEHSVCLDPGHSANCPPSEIDPETGLDVADNGGAAGEIESVWELAMVTRRILEQMGYRVVLTKESPYSYVNLKKRAEIGNTCSIVIRLHYDPGLHALLYPGEGQYKERAGRRHYVDPEVARGSNRLASALFPYLNRVGITRLLNDVGGTSNNQGPAFVGSVFSRVPVVLVENDPRMVRDNPAGREEVARAIAEGVRAYFRAQ